MLAGSEHLCQSNVYSASLQISMLDSDATQCTQVDTLCTGKHFVLLSSTEYCMLVRDGRL